jgi:hypothetical protein
MHYDTNAIFFAGAILVFVLLLFGVFCVGIWAQRHSVGYSPYTGTPLRRAADLPYESVRSILQFLYDHHEYANRLIDLNNAVFCRETGRIFPDAISWLDTVHVNWDFIQKRHPGMYVSWGSLTELQQIAIMDAHDTLEGFQIENSSPTPSPRGVEKQYAYLKPGPLYVDINTKVLLGWKCVPDTEFEVMIVQKPKTLLRMGVT